MSKRQKHLNGRLRHFWKVWQTEYLSALRETHKSSTTKKSTPIALEDVVIIHEEHLPRQRWSLGRVVELLQGNDGQIRSAKLQTSNGNTITRPLYKLYPLESVHARYQKDNNTSMLPVEEVQEAEDEIEGDSETEQSIIGETPRREASVRAELKMKYGQM